MRLNVEGLTYSYGARSDAIRDISLHVDRGEFVGLIGPNGSGKSTVLKNIYRGLTPDHGKIYLDGENLQKMSFRKSAQKLAVVGQENDVPFDFLVEEIVAMGRTPHKKLFDPDNAHDKQIVHHALEHLGMENMAKRNYLHLSGGEKQRVIIARAVAQESDFLILDEPTNHLDFETMEWLEQFLGSYTGAILAVSHDRYFLDSVCNRIFEFEEHTLTMYKGNYSAYLPQKEAAVALQQKQHDADVEKAQKLEDYIARNLVRASTTKMAQSRRKQLERLEITQAPKTTHT